jgi:threonyl-tRNA synthetase
MPFWHPKGMVIWNAARDLRRRENARRGYVEVKTPLLYDEETYETSGHLQNYEENIFWVQGHEEGEKRLALKPMNCPGHMLLFGSALRSYRDLPFRYAESSDAPPRRAHGTLLGLLRVRHITQDDAHIFCSADQIEDEVFACLDYASYLYDLFGMEPASSSRLGPTRSSAPTRSGTSPKALFARHSTGAASTTSSTTATARSTGRRSICT